MPGHSTFLTLVKGHDECVVVSTEKSSTLYHDELQNLILLNPFILIYRIKIYIYFCLFQNENIIQCTKYYGDQVLRTSALLLLLIIF